MNMDSEERFHELAHKRIARQSLPAEDAELDAMLSADPARKMEFNQLTEEAALVREVLPLAEALQQPIASPQNVPVERLRAQVHAAFQKHQESKGRAPELLQALKQAVASCASAAEKQAGFALLRQLEDLFAGGIKRLQAQSQALAEEAVGSYRMQARMEEMPRAVASQMLRKALRQEMPSPPHREKELEMRLRDLEGRLGSVMELLTELSQETTMILKELRDTREELLRTRKSRGPGEDPDQ